MKYIAFDWFRSDDPTSGGNDTQLFTRATDCRLQNADCGLNDHDRNGESRKSDCGFEPAFVPCGRRRVRSPLTDYRLPITPPTGRGRSVRTSFCLLKKQSLFSAFSAPLRPSDAIPSAR